MLPKVVVVGKSADPTRSCHCMACVASGIVAVLFVEIWWNLLCLWSQALIVDRALLARPMCTLNTNCMPCHDVIRHGMHHGWGAMAGSQLRLEPVATLD
jgi:hypothetical protein